MTEGNFDYPPNNYQGFEKGQVVFVETTNGTEERKVLNIIDSGKIASILNLKHTIKLPIPVLILDKPIAGGAAHYHPELQVIFAYNDTKPEIMHHEIIHSLEMSKPLKPELLAFYEKILERMPDTTNISPNFRKNIHEFIADAYSKEGLIKTMRQEGLYEEFEELSSYIFE